MTVAQAIAQTRALTGQTVDTGVMLRWLSELDGQIAFEVFGQNRWKPYISGDDGASVPSNDKTLLVTAPYDGLYIPYLAAMTYFSAGEYERYGNEQVMHAQMLGEFRRVVQRTKSRCGEITIRMAGNGGSGDEIVIRED